MERSWPVGIAVLKLLSLRVGSQNQARCTRFRNGLMGCVLALLALHGATPLTAQQPVACSAATEPRPLRAGGLEELVSEVVIECQGGASGSLSVAHRLENAPLANTRFQDISLGSLFDALVLFNDPAPENQIEGSSVSSLLEPDPVAPGFEGFTGAFGLGYQPSGTVYRIVNVRADVSRLPVGEQVLASLLVLASSGEPILQELLPLGTVAAGFDAEVQALPGRVRLSLAEEGGPGLFRKRVATDAAGALQRQNVPGARYGTESGFIPEFDDLAEPPNQGLAGHGTRFAVELPAAPPGVTFRAPGCVASNDASSGLEIRSVSGFEADFSGGQPDAMCDTSPKEVADVMLYEVTGSSGVTGAEIQDRFLIDLAADCAGDSVNGPLTLRARLAPSGPSASGGGAPQQAVQASFPRFAESAFREFQIESARLCGEPPPKPVVPSAAVLNAASSEPGLAVAPGVLVSIFGENLAGSTVLAPAVPLPRSLGGVTVTIGGVTAPLAFVSPGQINAQFPWEATLNRGAGQAAKIAAQNTDTATLIVENSGVAGDPVEIPVSDLSPGVFTFDFGPGRAVAINPDGSVAQPAGSLDGVDTRPARIGQPLVLLATGLGPTSPPAETGDDSLDQNGAFVQRDTTTPVRVFLGGAEAVVFFAGMSPEFVGVQQINITRVPETVSPGDAVSLIVEVGELRSRDDVTIAVAEAAP